MKLALDGMFIIKAEASYLILTSGSWFYFCGSTDGPLGNKTYLAPANIQIVASFVAAASHAPDVDIEVSEAELNRLIGISKLVKNP